MNKPLCAVCFLQEDVSFVAIPEGQRIEGFITSEPQIRPTSQQFEVQTKDARILVFVSRYDKFNYGDYIRVLGEVKKPENFSTFDYQQFLLRKGIQGVSYYPALIVLEQSQKRDVWHFMYGLKDKLRKPILVGLSEPHGSFILAMTLGDSWRLTQDFRNLLSRSGTAHIAAISGLHMAILVGLVFFALVLAGLSRPVATGATVLIITFYTALVGFPASAIRAGIMGILVLLGYLLGRIYRLFYALLLAALFMLLWDISLIYQPGFQLSFSAVGALVTIYQPVRQKIYEWLGIKEQWLLDIFIASLVITLLITPILWYHFGQISLVSPLANMFVLPLLPATMLLGFGAELTGWSVFMWPLWLVVEYQVQMITFWGSLL